jgi:hypothetical protein
MLHSMSRGIAARSWEPLKTKGIPLQHDATRELIIQTKSNPLRSLILEYI